MAGAVVSWPYDPASTEVDQAIMWGDADPDIVTAPLKLWRQVSAGDARKLIKQTDLFDLLPDPVQDVVRRRAGVQPSTGKADRGSSKETIQAQVTEVMEEARATSDHAMVLKALELSAKLDQLLSHKEIPDPVITIHVTTGVPR